MMKAISKIFGFGALGCLLCCGGTVLLLGAASASAALTEIVNCYRDPLWLVAGSAVTATLWALGFCTSRASKHCARPVPTQEPAATVKSVSVSQIPIACTLPPTNFQDRLDELKALAADALTSAHRQGLTLHLRYPAEAEQRVCHMIEKEEACCPFLAFDLQKEHSGIHLLVTAPEAGRQSIELIYEQLRGDRMLAIL